MDQPAIFISCVSPEFRQTRSRVAAILTRLGYTPVIQEIFGTEPGELRQVLRDKIDACEGLIQIVGQSFGAEPPTVDANKTLDAGASLAIAILESLVKPAPMNPLIWISRTARP
ncbi:MAG TPA: DUF4062 domain-containing protein [Chthoniobacterales bacterium]|nr:DUF4062 domain-containing protein [Chthoniobacterales bacterium]